MSQEDYLREINVDGFRLARFAAVVVLAAAAVSRSVFLVRSAAGELELDRLGNAHFFKTHFVAQSRFRFEEILDFDTVRRISRAHLAQFRFFLHLAFLKISRVLTVLEFFWLPRCCLSLARERPSRSF